MRWILLLLATLSLMACSSALPSSVPLGTGPQAEREATDELESGTKDKTAKAQAKTADHEATDEAEDEKEEETSPEASKEDESDEAEAKEEAEGEEEEDSAPRQVIRSHRRFAGEYSGHDTTTIRWSGEPQEKHPDPNARIKIERTSDEEVEIVVINSATGDPFCTLTGKINDNKATITPGQTYPDSGVVAGMTGTVTKGNVKVLGTRMIMNLVADVEKEVDGQPVTGELTYHFEGRRQHD